MEIDNKFKQLIADYNQLIDKKNGGEGNRYNFPSQRKFDLNEIEPALRRERTRSKERKLEILAWIIFIGTLLATICHFTYEKTLVPTAHAEGYSNQTELCSQYLGDTALAGTAAEITLNQICL